MMKDEELEKAFNGYFEGVNTPDNLTQDAKKHVKKRSAFLPAFAKYVSIAASIILVCALGIVLFSRSNIFKAENGGESDSQPALLTYSDEQITKSEIDAYALSQADDSPKFVQSLKFIQTLAYSQNAAVNALEIATFDDDKTAHVRADISLVSGARYDAEVYVEFAEYTYEPLTEYRLGDAGYYRGINYSLIRATDEQSGELVTMLYAQKGGVKYYFNVLSSDRDSYIKCLQLIL